MEHEWESLGRVDVRLVRADHHHRPMPHRPNDAHGHLVRGRSATVWVAGDTSLHPEMADLPRQAGRAGDVAVVPVWGWGPRLSAGHMHPGQAAEALMRKIITHWSIITGRDIKAGKVAPSDAPRRVSAPALTPAAQRSCQELISALPVRLGERAARPVDDGHETGPFSPENNLFDHAIERVPTSLTQAGGG